MPQKHIIEDGVKPQQHSITEKVRTKKRCLEVKVELQMQSMGEKIMPQKSTMEEKERMMVEKHSENAELIKPILEGNHTEDVDCKMADLRNVDTSETEITRCQGSKKQRCKPMPQKHIIEDGVKHQQHSITGNMRTKKWCLEVKAVHQMQSMGEKIMPRESSVEEKERMMVEKLSENAELIKAILEGSHTEDMDCKMANLRNVDTLETDKTRCQGDKIIACLRNIADTLNQLCNLVQECA